LTIQAQEDSTHAYEVLFRRLHMLGIAVVNKHSDIIWVVAITIWPKKSDPISESREESEDNSERPCLAEVVAYFEHRREDP
jgi:hypothetical protein